MKRILSILIALSISTAITTADLIMGDVFFMETRSVPNDGTSTAVRNDGNTWNNVDFVDVSSGADLLLADGSDELITITATAYAGGNKNNGGTAQTNLAWIASDAGVNNFMYSEAGFAISFHIDGLDTNFTYNVSWTANGNTTAYESQDNTINGAFGVNSDDFNAYTAGNGTGPSEMTWNGISLNGSDQLAFSIIGNTGERGATGMIRIEAVPEPSSIMMLGIAALVLYVRRRRRHTSL